MKVLIVSNDRALLRHASRFLGTFGYETTQVADYERAAEIAGENSADLFLVDSEPDFDRALGLCRTVSGRPAPGGRYILLLADPNSRAGLLDAVGAGADDILSKPIVYGEVLRRLRAGAMALEFQRRAGQQRRRDPITGLLTEAAFRARLQAHQKEAFSCLMIAVDFYEVAVRSMGRTVEHAVLNDMARMLEDLSSDDRTELAHFGDGQFCLLLPNTTTVEAVQRGEKIRSQVAGTTFLAEESKLSLTASVGVAGTDSPANSPQTIVEKCKQALKSAEASGHDCVVQANQFADEELAWRELAAPGRLFERTVARDVMLSCTVLLRSKDTIGCAHSLFERTGLRTLVVTEAEETFSGTCSAEDVAEYLQTSGDPDEPVSRIMVRDVDTVKESAPFADLMKIFAESDSEHIVVLDEGRPTGMVSAVSLARLGQAPESPSRPETPSMGSDYLRVSEPLELCSSTDTV